MRFFLRRFQVIIGDEEIGSSDVTNARNNAIAIPKDPFSTSLQIKFKVATGQSTDSQSNNFVSIYNLSDDTQSFIRERGARIRLLAGYDDHLSIIYDGTITEVNISNLGAKNITKINLSPQIFNITDAIFNRSYSSIVTTKTIIQDSIDSFNTNDTIFDILNIAIIPTFQYENFSFFWKNKRPF